MAHEECRDFRAPSQVAALWLPNDFTSGPLRVSVQTLWIAVLSAAKVLSPIGELARSSLEPGPPY